MSDVQRIVQPSTSLIKFNSPIIVQEKFVAKLEDSGGAIPKVPPKKSVDIQEILNCIVPPKEYEQNGQLWRQEVSAEPATRSDVEKLSKELNARLEHLQARATGLCKVRNELYTEAFNELIRQVTVNCAERGVLLLAVRDEIEMTTRAYQTLYESSIAYGLRKALLAEEGKAEMESQIQDMRDALVEAEEKLTAMKHKYAMMERRAEELREAEERKHKEEINFLKKTNFQLKEDILLSTNGLLPKL